MATDKSSQLDFISVKPDILKLPSVLLQVWGTPLYGYYSAVHIPCYLTYLKASPGYPPVHALPEWLAQSMSCWSERIWSFPSVILLKPYKAAVDENTHAAAHWPWFLTGTTAPCCVQSISPAL